jgi:hypothetical protein
MEEFQTTPSGWKEQQNLSMERQVEVLDEKEAEFYIQRMIHELSGLKTETELYRKAVLIRQLSQNGLLNREVHIEVDLLHPDNYIEAYGERINAWYGFDLMMNELNKNSFELELKIELSRQITQDEMEEVFTLLNRSAKHFSSKVVKCWSFVVVFHESEQLNFARQIQKRIQKEYPHLECTIKCM